MINLDLNKSELLELVQALTLRKVLLINVNPLLHQHNIAETNHLIRKLQHAYDQKEIEEK